MMEVTSAVKRFGALCALDGAELRAERQSVYGLIGANGAGKSTLLRAMAGACRLDAGAVLLDGQPVHECPERKARVVLLPDELYSFVSASVADMRRLYRGLYSRFDDGRYARLREIFTLDERAPIRRMSKGQRKQAAFWLALCLHPQVLLLDEPVDGLDPVMRRQMWSVLLADVAEEGTSVVLSSHNLRELEDVCDRIGILHRANLLRECDLSAVQEGLCKLQYAGERAPEGLDILHESASGQLRTLIVRADAAQAAQAAERAQPAFYDVLPLSLEEIFIYELGGEIYAVRELLL